MRDINDITHYSTNVSESLIKDNTISYSGIKGSSLSVSEIFTKGRWLYIDKIGWFRNVQTKVAGGIITFNINDLSTNENPYIKEYLNQFPSFNNMVYNEFDNIIPNYKKTKIDIKDLQISKNLNINGKLVTNNDFIANNILLNGKIYWSK